MNNRPKAVPLRIIIAVTAAIFVFSSLIYRDGMCCMYTAIRYYGFPGEFITVSKGTELLQEAQAMSNYSTIELLQQGYRIGFGAPINSRCTMYPAVNAALNLIFCALIAGMLYVGGLAAMRFKKSNRNVA